jgi:outer membrane protein assembly factor BamB
MKRLPSGLVALTLVFVYAVSARAGVYSGTLKSVDSNFGQISVEFVSRKQPKSFRLSRSTPVTLDGKKTKIAQLKPGQKVSVFTNKSGRVLRVIARTRSASRPEPRPTQLAATDSSSPTLSDTKPGQESPGTSSAAWTGFRGHQRDNISKEQKLAQKWPRKGPPRLWSAPGLGEGYSTVSVARGMVFTMGYRRKRESILALDLQSGEPVWSADTGGSAYKQRRGNGPRGTPTIDGDKVYALGASGDLACVELKTGNLLWSKNILQEFGVDNIFWGISESVLIDGDRLICTPGGEEATMVALDKRTGDVIWRASVPGNPSAAYSSPIVVEVGGVRQYVNFTSSAVVGIRADDGEFLWQDTTSANDTANCPTPLFYDGHVFSASGYGAGGTLLRLTSRGKKTDVIEVYRTQKMYVRHGGMLIVDGYLYGSNDSGILTCLEVNGGKVMWRNRSFDKGSISIVYADGHLYLRSDDGPVALIEATPEGYREKSRFEQTRRSDRPAWAHPVVADGKLFLRDMNVLQCYDLTRR